MTSFKTKSILTNIPDFLYKVGWLGILIGLPLNKVVLSVGVMSLSLGTFLYFFTKKIQKPIAKPGLLLTGFFLLFSIGLLWSSDPGNGLKQLRIYLPLLSVGVGLLYFDYFRKWEFKILWYAFNLTLSTVLFFNLFFYFKEQPLDIREMSLFTSHIRLGLILFTAILINSYWILQKQWIWIFPSIFFAVYLLYSQSLTALFLGGISIFCGALFYIYLKKNTKYLITLISSITILILIGTYKIQEYNHKYYTPPNIDYKQLPKKTARGGIYKHIEEYRDIENNQYVFTYLCLEELHDSWTEVSEIPFNPDNKGDSEIFWTLIRYMTSKGLKKDAEDFKKLSLEDIQNIEKGITNIRLVNASPSAQKAYELFYEYYQLKNGGDLMNTSVSSRLIYNSTALKSERNYILGGGTGSVDQLMHESYQKNFPHLDASLNQKPHNQWISILIEQGFLALIILIVFSAFIVLKAFNQSILLGVILCLAFLSFINDDTLSTQVGASYFCLALASHIFIRPFKDLKGF